MTRAPDNLLAIRRLLLDHLDVDPDTVRTADLEPGEVGIVGNASHRGGYHCGSDRLDASRDYSVVESARDHIGLTLDASALDVGMFTVVSAGRTHDLRTFSTWCVAQCAAGTADTGDIREVIYSPDGRTVKRWDRLGKRSSGDSSHLTHTHFSFFRDSTRAGRDLTPLFRRYLTTIGLLEDDMLTADDRAAIRTQVALGLYDVLYVAATGRDYRGLTYSGTGSVGAAVRANLAALTAGPVVAALGEVIARESANPDEVRALLAALPQPDPVAVDEQAIVAGVLAGLTPEAIAAAIPPELAAQVADELARRIVE